MVQSDGKEGEWSKDGTEVFATLSQHAQLLGNKNVCRETDLEGQETDFVKWRDEVEMQADVCQSIASKLWSWSTAFVREKLKELQKSKKLKEGDIAKQMGKGVTSQDVSQWVSTKSGGDEQLKQHIKKVVDWFGEPPEWKCTKCGRTLSEFGSTGGLISHYNNCRGPLMVHTEGSEGEWSEHGTDMFDVMRC